MERPDVILFGVSAVASAGVLGWLWRADVIRPTSFPAGARTQRDVKAVPAPVWLVCWAMVFLTQAFVATAVRGGSGLGEGVRRDGLVGLAVYGAALGVGVLLAALLRSQVSERSGLRIAAEDVGKGVVGFLAVLPVCVLVNYAAQQLATLVEGAKPDAIAHETLREIVEQRNSVWGWLVAANATLLAPAVEEIMYRGFLQSCTLKALERTWPAIIGTSALFAAMHWAGGGPVPLHALPVLFVLSVGMGVAFERTRSLGVPIVMHVLFNAANIAVAVLQRAT